MLIMCSPKQHKTTWPNAMVDEWKTNKTTGDIVAKVTFAANDGTFADIPNTIRAEIRDSLRKRGIHGVYSHQIRAWNCLLSGRNIVLSTPTASGKTLSYNVPVVETLHGETSSTSLYLFPTKALSRDQEESVRATCLATGLDPIVSVYDGDTPSEERRFARTNARVLITNPDMLHMGILPHHAGWARFFSGLRFVVVDELHSYRGVFGSHVANVIRRLKRIASFYGARPVFAACSATIANPRQLAETIVGENIELIAESGAPTGSKTFVFYNPRLIDRERGIRKSCLEEAATLAGDLVRNGHTTLVFARSRRGVEIVLRYLRDTLSNCGWDSGRLKGYRGGYLPTVRREIETALKAGELDGVVATNALELGIDVGSLDAVVMAGYPGTVAGFHQRAGRAGRRLAPSLSVLVASANPLDQFLVREPDYLLRSSPESALVHPDNVEVLLGHIKCAAFELPFSVGDSFGRLDVADTQAALGFVEEDGDLNLSKGRYFFVGESYPAEEVSLRNISGDRVLVVDKASLVPIAEVDGRRARVELHEQAIYLLEGRTYLVESLDLEPGKALVTEMEPIYYTTPMIGVDVGIQTHYERKTLPGGTLGLGEVVVTEEITGFKKVRFHTHENLGYGTVDLPAVSLDTEALWLLPASRLFSVLKDYKEAELLQGLSCMGYALHQVASLRLMCDPHDMAFVAKGVQDIGEAEPGAPLALFFFDTHQGGVGLASRAFESIKDFLRDTEKLIKGCECSEGCPSCIGPLETGLKTAKDISVAFVKGLLGLTAVS